MKLVEGLRAGQINSSKDPRGKATLISKLFFCWLDPLIWKGYKRELKQEDLYVIPREVESQALLKQFNRHWRVELQRAERKLKPRLWFALIQCFKWNLLLHGIMYFILVFALYTRVELVVVIECASSVGTI